MTSTFNLPDDVSARDLDDEKPSIDEQIEREEIKGDMERELDDEE